MKYAFSTLKKTALFDFHSAKMHAKMVPFAGYHMPVQYPQGVLNEHLNTRNNASIFDVSHMGQLKISGKDHLKFLERVTVADISSKLKGNAVLSLILNHNAGIIDDCILTKEDDFVYVVVNGANKMIDLQHFAKVKNDENFTQVQIEHLQD